jgi:hypothetical protein
MKTTKAFIASFGTSALLVGSSVTMLAVVSAVLAFRAVPGPAVSTQAPSVVVDAARQSAPAIQISKNDVQSAGQSQQRSQQSQATQGTSGSSSSSSPSDSGATAGSTPSDSGSSGTGSPPDDGGSGGGQGDVLRDRIRNLPNDLRSTVGDVDLGKTGRGATRVLSDGVLGKVSPKLGENVKKATEPVWKLLDRDR